MSKRVKNIDEWKQASGPQFRSIVEQNGEMLVVERIKDNKKFSLGPHLYSGGGVFLIKEFMSNMKHIRFIIDGNPQTNTKGQSFSVKTIGRLPINSLKISNNGREISF